MTDHITRYATTDHLAIAVVRCTDTVATIAGQHGLRGEPQQIMGEAITATLLMGTRLKGPGVLNFSLRCEQAFAHMRIDAIGMGSVRGMVTESVREQLQAWNGVDQLIGAGEVEVVKQLQQEAQPYLSRIAVDDIRPAWAANRYLATSEQVDACVLVDVRLRDNQVSEATGVYIERLPGADEEDSGVQHYAATNRPLSMASPWAWPVIKTTMAWLSASSLILNWSTCTNTMLVSIAPARVSALSARRGIDGSTTRFSRKWRIKNHL